MAWQTRACRRRSAARLAASEWLFLVSVNYGFVPGLIAPDGESLDAYVLGATEPILTYDGEVIGVLLRADDVEDKLVVGRADRWSTADIAAAVHFQERFFDSRVVAATP